MQAFCVKLNLQSGKCAAVFLGVSIVLHSIIMITKHSQDSKASEFWGTPQMQSHADLHQYTSLKFRVGCHFWIISRKHDIKLQNMQNLIVTVESKKGENRVCTDSLYLLPECVLAIFLALPYPEVTTWHFCLRNLVRLQCSMYTAAVADSIFECCLILTLFI